MDELGEQKTTRCILLQKARIARKAALGRGLYKACNTNLYMMQHWYKAGNLSCLKSIEVGGGSLYGISRGAENWQICLE